MTRPLLAIALTAGLVATCAPAALTGQDQRPVIVIGSDLPLTGPLSPTVIPLRDAIELAIADRGSIQGFALRYESLDDALVGQYNPLKGEQNVKIFASDARVLGIVGPYNSLVAQFEIPVANDAGLTMISPSNTLDCLTAPNPCTSRPLTQINSYFRLAGTDAWQARAAALFAVRKLHLHRIAVLNDGTPFGTGATETFSSVVRASGGSVVFGRTYAQVADYRLLLREAAASGAESVFDADLFESPCRIRAQMSGIFPASAYLIAMDRVTDPGCISIVGTSDDHFLAMVSSCQPPPSSKIFKEFQAHRIPPVTYSFGAYDSATILIEAIARAMQSSGGALPSRRAVRDAVAETHGFSGACGNFTLQPNGDPTQPSVSAYRIDNGAWTFWQNAF